MASALPLSPVSGHALRLLVVDDSQVVRSVFQRILDRHPDYCVTGVCSSVDEALRFLQRQTVDIVLLDIEMPGRSGLEALPDIIERANGAKVIVVSSHVERHGGRNSEALAAGAYDTLAKPGCAGQGSNFAEALFQKIDGVANRGKRAAPLQLRQPQRRRRLVAGRCGLRPGCIAVGASTGGILGIQQFLSALPDQIDCPILITQHLPASFIPHFVRQLAARVRQSVEVGEPGKVIMPNHIYIAPGEGHLGCKRDGSRVRTIRIDGEFAAHYTPAVDPMLSSAATVFGPAAVGIVLSGMGLDGLEGARDLRAHGGTTIVQDQESSVVWGMPGGIAKAGLADAIMRPSEMGTYLWERSQAA